MMNRLNAGYQPTLPRTSVYDKVMRFASGGEVVTPPLPSRVDRILGLRQRIAALAARIHARA